MSLKEKLEAATHPHAKPPVYQQAPASVQHSPRGVQLTITIPALTVGATKEFYNKLPFLVLLLLVFSFSMVMFEKANFHSNDLVDFNRMQYNIPKFWSVSFILFLLLFALALALAVFYGFGQTWLLASITLPLTLIPAVAISF
ncbi:hypothetical protein H0N96_02665, partial [Candidatus Micrarchaeota archaeon]|nr:hypothetical protein [Candidatus Micrarchaeota archaeon]